MNAAAIKAYLLNFSSDSGFLEIEENNEAKVFPKLFAVIPRPTVVKAIAIYLKLSINLFNIKKIK
jgi:hypothetical protein